MSKVFPIIILLISLLIQIQLILAENYPCPCHEPGECERISDKTAVNQTLGYLLISEPKDWPKYHWEKLTIITLVDFHNDELMCMSHRNKVRIMALANFTLNDIQTDDQIDRWIEANLEQTKSKHYDGINLFIDDPIDDQQNKTKLTKFVQIVTEKFHQELPNSMVIFNVPFSPYNEEQKPVDGKDYDYLAISKLVDYLSIMDFNQRSQSTYWDAEQQKCLAGAPESLFVTIGSLMAWQNLNVQMNKLILTLGFYVDEYECIEYHQNFRCVIENVSYRGSNCSSVVANRIPWNVFESTGGDCWRSVWDEHSNHDIYTRLEDSIYGILKQYWSSYPAIWKKIQLINEYNMNGIGIWMLNYLDDPSWHDFPVRQKP